MTTLCASVQNLGKLMQDGFASESILRLLRDDVRQQAQNEIMEGLENEENAGQLVYGDLEIENFKLEVEVSYVVRQVLMWVLVLQTLSRPQALASRYDEIFYPRKMEFKGGITDNTRSSFSRKY